MGDAILKASAFLQDVREILRNRNEERAKCPRCRGSGLLHLHSNWREGQPSPSNAPCLFCEGIGVMPIVGLRGYIIGRTDAMLCTKEIKTHTIIPDKAELLHPGGFHGRKSTRFSIRRHYKIPPQALYNPLSSPSWILEAQREALLFKSSQMGAVEHSLDRRDGDDRSPVGLIGLDHAGWRHRYRFYARTSGSFSNSNSAQAGDMSPNFPVDSREQAGDSQLHFEGANLAGFKEAAEQVVDEGSLGHGRSNLQGRNKYVVSRGHRSSRRPRNRIREEIGKETEARARKVQRVQTQASDASANSWNPLLRMCRFVLLSRTFAAQKV